MSFLKKEKNISILETNDLKFFKGGAYSYMAIQRKICDLENARKKRFDTVSCVAVLKILH